MLRRAHFGRKSEKITAEQMELALDDVLAAMGAEDAKAEATSTIAKRNGEQKRKANRGHLPAHLPREEIVIEPDTTACPCCGGDLHQIGEDRSERLDKVPAKLRVLVTRRPKYADHTPLYRQSQIFARDGIIIDRSTLCHWGGSGAAELEPLHARLIQHLMRSTKLFCDETRCPVLDPGRGKTKTGYLWAIARYDRPWGGSDPPAVAYHYAPGRGGEHARALLAGFKGGGVLHVDGYDGYNGLADAARPSGAITLAYCWSHFRRRFYDLAKGGNAPIASAALDKIGALYGIETEIRGNSADARRTARQERTKPLIDALKAWLSGQYGKLPRASDTAKAINYGLDHWVGLTHFLDDGRIDIDTNSVERSIRPIALNRKNALFAGSDEGGANWAIVASLIETCKLNGVNPHAWLADTLTKLVNGRQASNIDDLMPWAYAKIPS